MADRREKRTIYLLGLLHLAFWVFFWSLFVLCRDMFAFASPTVRVWSAMDAVMAAGGAGAPPPALEWTVTIVVFAAIALNGLTAYALLRERERKQLPVRGLWWVLTACVVFGLYYLSYRYIKFEADYFRIWMKLVPYLFFSAGCLVMAAMGFCNRRAQRRREGRSGL